ncbi:hypothetical protein F0562_020249 [Nyssa sinensis]|uniref:non-specific serine/threonine protein kinase n=1 Tax=Nyssa sinensis TaxID=561372 RepID=A0A5J5BR63_9ASTE|nr:hypothetical protein F0562_020249 [Nyssa sinensis]
MNLCGFVSSVILSLDRLTELSLAGNNFTGEIKIENLSFLQSLNISNNLFNGGLDWNYSGLSNLEVFDAYNNNFTDFLPLGILSLEKLKYLDLGGNYFYGKIPESYGNLIGLEYLSLAGNDLIRKIPDELIELKQLKLLNLFMNRLHGSIPDFTADLPSLETLGLWMNNFTGVIPENLGQNEKLQQLDLSSNKLTAKLVQLNLSNNLLLGSLPFSLSNFSSLQILLLNGNKFSGPIPPSIGELQQVLKLDLRGNSLSGLIPPDIGNCFHLTYLDLSQNNLFGSIPSEISNIHILNYLNLSRNHLNETIPKSIGSMKSLTTADFSFNDLSGKLPESGQFSFFNASSFAGNPHLCGSLLNNPCNVTSIRNPPSKSPGEFKLIFALGLLLCSLIFAGVAIVKAKSFKRNSSDSWKMTAFQKVDFTVSDVLECTRDGNVIGRGGAGIVYHGKMPNGVEIAVKKLVGFSTSSHDHGFRAEIRTLGNIRHRNIVKLLAFCSNKETNLLVYEYMRNGSLGEALHGKKALIAVILIVTLTAATAIVVQKIQVFSPDPTMAIPVSSAAVVFYQTAIQIQGQGKGTMTIEETVVVGNSVVAVVIHHMMIILTRQRKMNPRSQRSLRDCQGRE